MPFLAWLALRELASRRWRSLLSLLALALSVGLLAATASLGALLQNSVAAAAPLLGRPGDLWVSSAYDVDYDLPANLAGRVAARPGVAAVQPLLRRPVRVQTPQDDHLTLLGVDLAAYLAFHDLRLAAGILPDGGSPGVVALAPWALVRDLGLGQPVTITTPTGDVALPLTGLVEVENLAAARQGLVIYAPLEVVADLFDLQERVTVLEVRLAPGAAPRRVRENLEQALGPAYAVSAAAQPGQGGQLWQRLVLGALYFVDVLVLAGAVSLVYAVFAAAGQARRRQIGLLRASGALRRQVLALLLVESAFLGLAGSGLGLLLGLLLARVGAALVLEQVGGPIRLPLPVGHLLLAAALGLLTSLVGALAPALQAARQQPLVALRPSSLRPAGRTRRTWRLWPWLARRWPEQRVEVRLAGQTLGREPGRAALITAALALILAMALGNVGVLSLLGEELAAALDRLSGGDYLLLPGLTSISLRELAGQDTSDVPPLAPGLLDAVEEIDDQVWSMGGTTANVEPLQVFPGQPTLLLDMEGYARMGGFEFQAGDWPGALASFRQGPAVLLAPVVARRLGLGLGDQLWLDTPAGPAAFRVAGIGNSEFTTCILDLADGAALLGANEVNAVMVKVRPGADANKVRRGLLDTVHDHGGTLLPLGQAAAQLRLAFQQAWLSMSLLIGVTGLVAGLGVINTMLAAVAGRRQEIGLLRAVGATRRQITRLILAEMALLGAVAAWLGTALGWAITLLFLALARNYLGLGSGGADSPAAWLPLLAASSAGLLLWPLLAMLGGLAPAWRAGRMPPVEALAVL